MRRRTLTAVAGACALSACVFGFRGERTFSDSAELTGIDAIRIRLPQTPLTVAGSANQSDLSWSGTWFVLSGGGEERAKRKTRLPNVEFDADGRFGELRAVIPLEVEGIADLEMDRVDMPADIDLEIQTGGGDVELSGVDAAINIDIDWGNVSVDGSQESIVIYTRDGDVDVNTPGEVNAITGRGNIDVVSTTEGASVSVGTYRGNVDVVIPSDANVHIHAYAPGRIFVDTAQISTITSGYYHREVGDGSVDIFLESAAGDITLRDAASDAAGDPNE